MATSKKNGSSPLFPTNKRSISEIFFWRKQSPNVLFSSAIPEAQTSRNKKIAPARKRPRLDSRRKDPWIFEGWMDSFQVHFSMKLRERMIEQHIRYARKPEEIKQPTTNNHNSNNSNNNNNNKKKKKKQKKKKKKKKRRTRTTNQPTPLIPRYTFYKLYCFCVRSLAWKFFGWSQGFDRCSWHFWSKVAFQKKVAMKSSRWWFQPIWKILVRLDHFPK